VDDDFRYKKTPDNEGTPDIPDNHTNAKPPYPRNDYNTIWQELCQHSTEVDGNAVDNTYPTSSWPTTVGVTWNNMYENENKALLRKHVDPTTADQEATAYADG